MLLQLFFEKIQYFLNFEKIQFWENIIAWPRHLKASGTWKTRCIYLVGRHYSVWIPNLRTFIIIPASQTPNLPPPLRSTVHTLGTTDPGQQWLVIQALHGPLVPPACLLLPCLCLWGPRVSLPHGLTVLPPSGPLAVTQPCKVRSLLPAVPSAWRACLPAFRMAGLSLHSHWCSGVTSLKGPFPALPVE